MSESESSIIVMQTKFSNIIQKRSLLCWSFEVFKLHAYDKNYNDRLPKFHSFKKYEVTALFIFYNTNPMTIDRLKRRTFMRHLWTEFYKSLFYLVYLLLELLESKSEHRFSRSKAKWSFLAEMSPLTLSIHSTSIPIFSVAATVHATLKLYYQELPEW